VKIINNKYWRGMLSSCAAGLLLSAMGAAQAKPVQVVVDAAKVGAPINKNVYGQFLEHGGDIVNSGLWAEMLVDRKFFYPVSAKAPTPPPIRFSGDGNPHFRRTPKQWWSPIGGEAAVTMDARAPYVGEQTPLVQLAGNEPRGVAQSGLLVRKGKDYVGRVVLAGSPTAHVSVTLIWGAGAQDRQTIALPALSADYQKFPLRFTALGETEDARIEITGAGEGSYHIGAVSLMPADNIEGFRAEVIAALKQLHSGVYRFPGGNFISSYEWRYGVGDIDKRPPIFDHVWSAVQPNDVGTDEFLTLCRLLDVEPYITVNAGFGDAWSARELVEYANGAADSPMGKWRAANGHPQPYGVKLWGIGNEPWGDYQMGSMAIDQYELKHEVFAKEMRKIDPSITLIAGGAMPDVMTGANQSKRIGGKFVPDYLSKADWTGHMLANELPYIDMVSEHYYSASNMHTDLKLEKKINIGPQSLVEWMRAPATQVRVKYEHYQKYLELIPELKKKPVPIAIDEWAYMGGGPNTYRTAPAYAWAFHEMFRHSELFQMGAFTFATAMMSQTRDQAVLNPTGLLFKLYREHFGVLPVAVSGDAPQPKPSFPAGGDQPAVNPGSDTYPLDVVAAWSADRKTLTVAVLNPSDKAEQMTLDVKNAKLATKGTLWRMAPSSLDAKVAVGVKPELAVEELPLSAMPKIIEAKPFSVNIYVYAAEAR